MYMKIPSTLGIFCSIGINNLRPLERDTGNTLAAE
jgi:hypothetical protein